MNFCKSVSLKMSYCPNLLTRYRFEECGPADRLNLVGMMTPCLLSTCRQSKGMHRATGSAILVVNLALARWRRATGSAILRINLAHATTHLATGRKILEINLALATIRRHPCKKLQFIIMMQELL